MLKKYILIGLLVLGAFFVLLHVATTKTIIVEFDSLEPFRKWIPVYFKGFRLGRVPKVYPTEDFRATRVEMHIHHKALKLPLNTTARFMIRDEDKEYMELVYPKTPYIEYLKHGSVIKGTMGTNLDSFLRDQAANGGLDEIKNNVNSTVRSAGETFNALTEMINMLTMILEDVRPTINSAVNNVDYASKNLADVSRSLKKSVDKGYIDKTLYNFQQTSGNLVITTDNFSGFSNGLNKQSIVLTNCLLKNLNIVVKNINQIVVGVGETMKKRFAGLRLIFGRVN